MAYLPSKATLIDNPVSIAPGFSLDNVHVFQGVPKIFEIMLTEFIKGIDKQKKFLKKISQLKYQRDYLLNMLVKFKKNILMLILVAILISKKSFGVSLIIKSDSEENLLDEVCDVIYKYLKKNDGKPRLF